MPHPIVHLGIALGAAYIITGGAKNGKEDWKLIAVCVGLQSLIDIDHILRRADNIFYFHNFTVALIIPLTIFIGASFPMPSKTTIRIRKIALLTAALCTAHVAMDLWTGGVYHVMYPLMSMESNVVDMTQAEVFAGTLTAGEITLVVSAAVVILSKLFFINLRAEAKDLEMLETLQELDQDDYVSRRESWSSAGEYDRAAYLIS